MGKPIESQRDPEELSDASEASEPKSPSLANPPLGTLELRGEVALGYYDRLPLALGL